ncbi:MAG: hypothetical protein PHU08_07885 [Dehalococcoidales bacterium]|nr:hypothetical protein [Dehalococcoidales bacterium]
MARITRLAIIKILSDVPEEKQFWCSNGQVFRNLSDLGVALGRMSEETFYYHANETKNDFGKWVREVVGDEKLARDLDKNRNALQAAKTVTSRITWLHNRS